MTGGLGRDREEDDERLLSLQRGGLIEDLEKQDYNLVVEQHLLLLPGAHK